MASSDRALVRSRRGPFAKVTPGSTATTGAPSRSALICHLTPANAGSAPVTPDTLRVNDAAREHGQIIAFHNRTYDLGKAVPTVVMRNEDYGRISRLLADKRAEKVAKDALKKAEDDYLQMTFDKGLRRRFTEAAEARRPTPPSR